MKRTRTKKTLRQQANEYWTEYWDNYQYYIQDNRHNSIFVKTPRSIPDSPKLKRNILYPKEFNFYSSCPKEWNKRYHIRPCRRQGKYMTNQSYVRCSRIQNEDMAYEAEERYYPQYKRHVYYW